MTVPTSVTPSERTATRCGSLRLRKLHGLGNDFLVLLDVDGSMPIDADLARRLCDRHTGIGADGLIRGTLDPFGFDLRNADGSQAEMSGNGMRCLGQALVLDGFAPWDHPFDVVTVSGRREVTVRATADPSVVWASVGMGPVRLIVESPAVVAPSPTGGVAESPGAALCNVADGRARVDVGNPHLVLLGPDPAKLPVSTLGPELEHAVPGGQNVEFVALGPGPDEITMRVWERGVGETQACGTGSCAAAFAVHHWGRAGSRVTVHQPGGSVAVAIQADGTVTLSGPSALIGEVTIPWV